MTYNDLIDYLLLQTRKGIQKSKYSKHVLDWSIEPEITLHKDGTVEFIEGCKVIIEVKDRRSLQFDIEFSYDITKNYTEDIVQKGLGCAISEYVNSTIGTGIEL